MTDNFDQIKTLLDFSEPNTFYFIQILKRRKENPDMKTGVAVIDNFYVYNLEDLDKLKEKVVERCTKHNARAYINLNKLELEKVALFTAKQIMDYIILGDYKAVKNAYAAVCGSHHSEKSKRWVVDIDEEILVHKDVVRNVIDNLHKEIDKNKYTILAEVPTRTGCHIITNPFNMEKFGKTMTALGITLDVQKNSPTCLYIPTF